MIRKRLWAVLVCPVFLFGGLALSAAPDWSLFTSKWGERPREPLRGSRSPLARLAGTLAPPPDRPNIVFILTDDLGANDLACYGRREHHTPNLDRLAAEGSRFTCAYVAQPICSPSRAAILTGKAPARLHLTTYLPGRPDCPSQPLLHPVIEQQLPLEAKTLAE